jgi:PAS domain S-box-containing protein/putative nucleotidyltransferase with HDIG domain
MQDDKRTRLLEDLDNVRNRITELEESEKHRAEAEKRLRDDAERYRHAVDSVPLGVYSVDVQGKFKYANTLLLKTFNLGTIDKAREIDIMNYPGFSETGISQEIRRCLETQKQSVFEHSVKDRNGNQTWLRHYINPIIGMDGSIDGVLSLVDDISHPKKIQAELNQKLETTRNLNTILSELVAVFDVEKAINSTISHLGDICQASRVSLFVIYEEGTKMDNTHEWCAPGVKPHIEELQTISLTKFSWLNKRLQQNQPAQVKDIKELPGEAKAEKEFFAKLDSKSFLYLPVQLQDKLGGLIGFSDTKEPRSWSEEDLNLLQIVAGVVGDFLEKKITDDAQRDRDVRFRRLAQASLESIFILKNGKILDANHLVGSLLGYKPSEYLGKEFVDFVDPKEKEDVEKRITINSAKAFEATARKKDGTLFPVEVVAKNLMIQEEPMTVVALRDISDRKGQDKGGQEAAAVLKEALDGTIEAMALTIALRDPFAAGHGDSVARLSIAIAQEMGLAEEQIEGLRVAGIIHDIGKVSLPTEILSKPGEISDAERLLIENHPKMGHDLIKDIKFPWPVAQMILQHHERMNGTGYPAGLSGDKLMLEARILAVADTVDAIMSDRSYRPAKGLESVIEELSKNKGTLYDPKVVDAALKVINERGFPLKK